MLFLKNLHDKHNELLLFFITYINGLFTFCCTNRGSFLLTGPPPGRLFMRVSESERERMNEKRKKNCIKFYNVWLHKPYSAHILSPTRSKRSTCFMTRRFMIWVWSFKKGKNHKGHWFFYYTWFYWTPFMASPTTAKIKKYKWCNGFLFLVLPLCRHPSFEREIVFLFRWLPPFPVVLQELLPVPIPPFDHAPIHTKKCGPSKNLIELRRF